MISDSLNNYLQYEQAHPYFARAFDFLRSTDLQNISEGKHELDGDQLFAIVMEYDTKKEEELQYEGHHKYIDLQYIVGGKEQMGVAPKNGQQPIESNLDDDYEFYDISGTLLPFEKGTFMILYPNDLHKPCITAGSTSKVRKVVVKIAVK